MIIDTDQLFKCETCRWHGPLRCNSYCDHMEGYSPNINKLKPVDLEALGYEKVVKGQWIDGAFDNSKRCSVCGKYATKIHNYDQPVFDYKSCPYCHAIMEEFEE